MSGDTETGKLLDVAASGGQVHLLTQIFGAYWEHPVRMFRFSSMKAQGGLNVRMVVTLAPQPSILY